MSATTSLRPRSSSRKPSGPVGGDVLEEAVRVRVVRNVEVKTSVAVVVGEDDTEAVVDLLGLDAGLPRDLAEARAPLRVRAEVEVELVAHGPVVAREAAGGARYGVVQVGVARDVEVRPAVAVHVAGRGAAVPAEARDAGRAGALDERPVAAVPEQRVVAGSGDVEVGAPVVVQVGGDAAVPSQRDVCARPAADVDEPAALVVEERATRQYRRDAATASGRARSSTS